jgi:hypothetical protein
VTGKKPAKRKFLKSKHSQVIAVVAAVVVLIGVIVNIIIPALVGGDSADSQSTLQPSATPTARAQTPQTTPDDPQEYDYSEYDLPEGEHLCQRPDGIPEEVLEKQDEFVEDTSLVSADSAGMQFVLNPEAPVEEQIEVLYFQKDELGGYCYYLLGTPPYLLRSAEVIYEGLGGSECRTHVPPRYEQRSGKHVVMVDCTNGF